MMRSKKIDLGKSRSLLGVSAIGPALALIATMGLAIPAQAQTPVRYVALGDSYSSGTGVPPYDLSSDCLRSSNAYPLLWAQDHGLSPGTNFQSVACAVPATAVDVRQKQLGALSNNTTLVTVSAGADDGPGPLPEIIPESLWLAQNCAGFGTDTEARCRREVLAEQAFIADKLPDRLNQLYSDIQLRAPSARVVVVGYPRLFTDKDVRCSDLIGNTLAKRRLLNDLADRLDEAISAAVARYQGFTFLDPRDSFQPHTICGDADPWINSITTPTKMSDADLLSSYDPNLPGNNDGYRALLEKITDSGEA